MIQGCIIKGGCPVKPERVVALAIVLNLES